MASSDKNGPLRTERSCVAEQGFRIQVPCGLGVLFPGVNEILVSPVVSGGLRELSFARS